MSSELWVVDIRVLCSIFCEVGSIYLGNMQLVEVTRGTGDYPVVTVSPRAVKHPLQTTAQIIRQLKTSDSKIKKHV